ncbi:MAG TPA: Vms1/Ankzf1 family peptidyl-tRNA hydrolase [Thermoleophilaceae bacterium]|nr:Vms1/Ankzf1 family peptidyl-tRNA hydrolase [Thermoleophilaceae bacterium]
MAANTLTRGRLRRLADVHPDRGRVLSVFLNLDPAEFATPAARSSAITSVMTEAARRIEEAGDLEHDERQALRADVERVREVLNGDVASNGTRAVAVFACEPADLLEVVALREPLDSRVVLDDSPYVEPLVHAGGAERWCVLLCNRRAARLFVGRGDELEETDRIEDDVHRQHDQGGWSQARYQRSVDQDAKRHLERVAKALGQRHRRQPFQHLLVGGPEDAYSEFVELLDQELSGMLAGRVDGIDVEAATPDQIAEAAAPAMEEHERKRQDELIGRLNEGLGRGERAAAGLDDVLAALNEQRVEALLIDAGLSAPGAQCPSCGWIGSVTEGDCPADETRLEPRPNVLDPAIERALAQDARVVRLRERPELESHGGIAAVLRF